MRCNLIAAINEVTIRDYTLIEDAGLRDHCGVDFLPGISFEYEEDEEEPGKHMIVVRGQTLEALFKWLSFVELQVKIIH